MGQRGSYTVLSQSHKAKLILANLIFDYQKIWNEIKENYEGKSNTWFKINMIIIIFFILVVHKS